MAKLQWIHGGDTVMIEGEGPFTVDAIGIKMSGTPNVGDDVGEIHVRVRRGDGMVADTAPEKCVLVEPAEMRSPGSFAVGDKGRQYVVWPSPVRARASCVAMILDGRVAKLETILDEAAKN